MFGDRHRRNNDAHDDGDNYEYLQQSLDHLLERVDNVFIRVVFDSSSHHRHHHNQQAHHYIRWGRARVLALGSAAGFDLK